MKQVFIGGFIITSVCLAILVSKQNRRNEIDKRVRQIEKVNRIR